MTTIELNCEEKPEIKLFKTKDGWKIYICLSCERDTREGVRASGYKNGAPSPSPSPSRPPPSHTLPPPTHPHAPTPEAADAREHARLGTLAHARGQKQETFALVNESKSLNWDIEEVISEWSGYMHLPRIQTLAGRVEKIRRALKDPFWREHWKKALNTLAKIRMSKKGKRFHWLDFNWFLRPDNVESLVNGKYDDVISELDKQHKTKTFTRDTI